MRKFVLNFSAIAKPLTVLTKKDQKFSWGDPEETALIKLKERLCSDPILYTVQSRFLEAVPGLHRWIRRRYGRDSRSGTGWPGTRHRVHQ